MEDKLRFIDAKIDDKIATITFNRGKVNAINGQVVSEIKSHFKKYENDPNINAIILTGHGNFFSFGFDIPEFLNFKKGDFHSFLTGFSDLYTYLFLYPKPVIALLNGHAIAGGCMIALACDYRIMKIGKSKISLNEIEFGSTVFAGATEMLRFCTGNYNASKILYSGAMYSANEALDLSLIDLAVSEDKLLESAMQKASYFSSKPSQAFASIKSLLRRPVYDVMREKEQASIIDLVDIWYSEQTWKNLQDIKINQ